MARCPRIDLTRKEGIVAREWIIQAEQSDGCWTDCAWGAADDGGRVIAVYETWQSAQAVADVMKHHSGGRQLRVVPFTDS